MRASNAVILREFKFQLDAFAKLDVALRARDVFHEATEIAAEAMVIGNEFGPGAPLDTGFLRGGFRVGIDVASRSGPRKPRKGAKGQRSRAKGSTGGSPLDLSPIAKAVLGKSVFVTTMVGYASYLEQRTDLRRRNGPSALLGSRTWFVSPVEQMWPAIVALAESRAGWGR